MDQKTSASLLERVRDHDDDAAWERLYDIYVPVIMRICRANHCSEDIVLDVVQETLVRLMRYLQTLNYDPAKGKFRSYLYRVVQTSLSRTRRRQYDFRFINPEEMNRQSMDDFLGADENEFYQDWEQEWQRALLEKALIRVKLKVAPRTFESFRQSVLEGRPPGVVAEQLGISRNAVYQHRNRIGCLIRKEVDAIRKETGDLE